MTRIRRLRVFVDPLVGGQVVAVRGDLLDAESDLGQQLPGDRFAVFAGPLLGSDEAALRIGVIRFTLEPIVERHKEDIEDARDALDALIARSEAAKLRYTNARVSLVTDSLVSALNARYLLRKNRLTPNGAIAALGDAHARGEVLAIHLFERLVRYEEVGLDIGVYFPEFIRSVDLEREKARGEQIAAAQAAAEHEPKPTMAVDAMAGDMLAADRMITESGSTRPARSSSACFARTTATPARYSGSHRWSRTRPTPSSATRTAPTRTATRPRPSGSRPR